MKIAIIGASGKAGQKIMAEALSRKHQVTAIVRNAGKVSDKSVTVLEKDIFDLAAADLKPFDAVVDAFNASPGHEDLHQSSLLHLRKILSGNPNTRLLVVGGASSLYLDEQLTQRLIDSPDFPDAYRATASNMGDAFRELKNANDINWTYISPSAMFVADGKRTGSYNTGNDRLMVNSAGESTISYADYAIAMLDEIEQGKHIRQRFTVVEK
ncbi:NAD(P)-dependent oxidoreductase [Budviciaceae bacterium BWR-B9]|uniref:NAD(P)-dependent oxidoreductase n=1 Tax=Limnobaculum allomyrinae TaxID=2791986 RepID=A0ABS1ITL9_9GAMM|nr:MULTISPECIES: NAD(P)-dependent oxidoreductase [Limnobaculum]MBK5145094.1 NAD(P)-dependent oxidoreductase [Limnobaculum allomyrinae]MBV7692925.1 NAD(P)-dependent oxidoreductase [Limnobaculum sp. M2-1]